MERSVRIETNGIHPTYVHLSFEFYANVEMTGSKKRITMSADSP